jgi:threonyl-tRNA synthetase
VNATNIIQKNLDFERITVSNDLAKEIFKYNKYFISALFILCVRKILLVLI